MSSDVLPTVSTSAAVDESPVDADEDAVLCTPAHTHTHTDTHTRTGAEASSGAHAAANGGAAVGAIANGDGKAEDALGEGEVPMDEDDDAKPSDAIEEEEKDAHPRTRKAARPRGRESAGAEVSAPPKAARKRAAPSGDKAVRAAEWERQLASIREEQARTQRARLRYLLGQSELFKHFVSDLETGAIKNRKSGKEDAEMLLGSPGRKSSSAAAGAAGMRSPSKRRAHSVAEAEEGDEELLRPTTRLSKQPSIVQGSMRDYQLEGLNWLISLHENGINGILADEMGLGKTLQTISLLGYIFEYLGNIGPHLILVPKSTLANWLNEIARWCPTLKAIKLHGAGDERGATIAEHLQPGIPQADRGWNILVTTYEVACIERATLQRIPWQYIVIDEAHRIKNEHSTLATVVRSFTSAHRLLITGTPLQNNLHELWALLNFLLPDVFGSSEAFDEWFNLAADSKDEEAKAQTVRQLHRVLRPFMLRRLKADVAKALPPKRETLLYVGMAPLQREVYRSILMRNMSAVLGERGAADRTRLSNLIMHLRKACNHPYLMEGVEDRTLDPMGDHLINNCAKLQLLDKLLQRLKERGSRVLIFSQMTSLLDILEDYCRIREHEYCRIDGSSGYEEREEAIDSFNAPGSTKFIFLLSTRAGGLGINLATADIVILYDSDWNPQADLQAQDRAHRIGQTKPVQVYRLITEGTVEEKVVERAMVKLKLDAVVVQQGRLADKSKGLSKDEMLEMIQFGANAVIKTTTGDSGVTDADIDEILRQGEAKTRDLTASVESRVGMGSGLLDFKIDNTSTQTFEGVDYSDEAARKKAEAERQRQLRAAFTQGMNDETFASRAARRTVLTYNEQQVFRTLSTEAAGTGPKEGAKLRMLLPPEHRPPGRMDPWTFIDRSRVMEITAMEIAHIENQREVMSRGGSLGGGATGDDAAALEPFPAELVAERKQLIDAGFPRWRKNDFLAFVKACAKHGRRNLDAIAAEMEPLGKSAAEVKRYSAVFWSQGPTVLEKRWPTIVGQIKRGEAGLSELYRFEATLSARLARTVPGYSVHAFTSMAGAAKERAGLADGAASASSKIPDSAFLLPPDFKLPFAPPTVSAAIPNALDPYSELCVTELRGVPRDLWTREVDAMLLAQAAAWGAGHPEIARLAILQSPRVMFDSFARSRTEEELDYRAKILLRAAERETLDAYRRHDREKAAAVAQEAPALKRRAQEETARRNMLLGAVTLRLDALAAAASAGQKDDDDKAGSDSGAEGAKPEKPKKARREKTEGEGAETKERKRPKDSATADTDAAAGKKRARPPKPEDADKPDASRKKKKAADAPDAAAADSDAEGKTGGLPEEFPELKEAARARAKSANESALASAVASGSTGYSALVPVFIGGSRPYTNATGLSSATLPDLCRTIAQCRARGVEGLIKEIMASDIGQGKGLESVGARAPKQRHLRAILPMLAAKREVKGEPVSWEIKDDFKRFLDMTPEQAIAALEKNPIELVLRRWQNFTLEEAAQAAANRERIEAEIEVDAAVLGSAPREAPAASKEAGAPARGRKAGHAEAAARDSPARAESKPRKPRKKVEDAADDERRNGVDANPDEESAAVSVRPLMVPTLGQPVLAAVGSAPVAPRLSTGGQPGGKLRPFPASTSLAALSTASARPVPLAVGTRAPLGSTVATSRMPGLSPPRAAGIPGSGGMDAHGVEMTTRELVRWRLVLEAATGQQAPEAIIAAYRILAPDVPLDTVVAQMRQVAERVPVEPGDHPRWQLRQPFLDMSYNRLPGRM